MNPYTYNLIQPLKSVLILSDAYTHCEYCDDDVSEKLYEKEALNWKNDDG
jgi:hypothetical protein